VHGKSLSKVKLTLTYAVSLENLTLMNKQIILSGLIAVFSFGCVKEISNEDRLDISTNKEIAGKTATAGELAKLKCDDINSELVKARDESRTEEQRLNTYNQLYTTVSDRLKTFENAISKNTDLEFQDGSEAVKSAREGCVQSKADVRLDFEGLVREIMQLLTVDEVKGGSTVKVARLNFESLKKALETLDLDDKDALLVKITNAEKTLGATTPNKKNR
jgi:hypothetical protein